MEQNQLKDVKISVSKKSKIKVLWASLFRSSEDIACVTLHLKQKRVEIVCYCGDSDGNLGIMLRPDTENDEPLTEVSFLEYKGWEFFAALTGKYRVDICLIKNKEEETKS